MLIPHVWFLSPHHPLLFLCGSDGKEFAFNVRDPGLIPGSGRSPGEGNGYPLQYSCLENPMDGGPWWGYSPQGCKKSDTTEWLTLLLHFHHPLQNWFFFFWARSDGSKGWDPATSPFSRCLHVQRCYCEKCRRSVEVKHMVSISWHILWGSSSGILFQSLK